jgi:transcriptional regulator with GAF, ATPase, and Fis domain
VSAPGSDGTAVGSRLFAVARVIDDANLIDSLQRIATAAAASVGNARAASITVIADRSPITMAASDDLATALDEAQYVASVGPCLTCARAETVIRVDDLDTDRRWPDLRRAAHEHGVTAALSVPLLLAEDDVFGAFNVYGSRPDAFSVDEEALVTGFAAHAAVMVSNVIAYWEAFDRARDLGATVEHRGVIEQAKGILMGAHRITPDEAFSTLRRRSRTEDRTLRDLALDVVSTTQPRPTS